MFERVRNPLLVNQLQVLEERGGGDDWNELQPSVGKPISRIESCVNSIQLILLIGATPLTEHCRITSYQQSEAMCVTQHVKVCQMCLGKQEEEEEE